MLFRSPFSVVATVASTSSASIGTGYSLPQTGLLGNTNYYYQIVAFAIANSSALTGTATTMPCSGGLSGTYTIPGSPYGSLTAAISALNTSGMAGAVTLELDPTYTSALEGVNFPITISNTIGCLNAANPLTIRPAATVASPLTITSANTTATIDINGGNFVTIDGRAGEIGRASCRERV